MQNKLIHATDKVQNLDTNTAPSFYIVNAQGLYLRVSQNSAWLQGLSLLLLQSFTHLTVSFPDNMISGCRLWLYLPIAPDDNIDLLLTLLQRVLIA